MRVTTICTLVSAFIFLFISSCDKASNEIVYPKSYSLVENEFTQPKGFVMTGVNTYKEQTDTNSELFTEWAQGALDELKGGEVFNYSLFDKVTLLNDQEGELQNNTPGSLDSGLYAILPYVLDGNQLKFQSSGGRYSFFPASDFSALETRQIVFIHKRVDEPNNDFLTYQIYPSETLDQASAFQNQFAVTNFGVGDTVYVFTYKLVYK